MIQRANSIPFEQWQAEKKRSLERVHMLKLQLGLREELEHDLLRAAQRVLGRTPDPSAPQTDRDY